MLSGLQLNAYFIGLATFSRKNVFVVSARLTDYQQVWYYLPIGRGLLIKLNTVHLPNRLLQQE